MVIPNAIPIYSERKRDLQEIDILNRRADALNKEAEDVLSTQVPVVIDDGLKIDSSIHCDELVSIPKSSLIHFIGTLRPEKIESLNRAPAVTIGLGSPV